MISKEKPNGPIKPCNFFFLCMKCFVFIPFIQQVMFFLCVSCCQDNLNSYGCIWIKPYKKVGKGQRHNWLFFILTPITLQILEIWKLFLTISRSNFTPNSSDTCFRSSAVLICVCVCVWGGGFSTRAKGDTVFWIIIYIRVYRWLLTNMSSSWIFMCQAFCPIRTWEVRVLALSFSSQPAGLLGSLANTLNLPLSTCGRCRKTSAHACCADAHGPCC